VEVVVVVVVKEVMMYAVILVIRVRLGFAWLRMTYFLTVSTILNSWLPCEICLEKIKKIFHRNISGFMNHPSKSRSTIFIAWNLRDAHII